MNEKELEQIEKIVQHTAKTITHQTAPETRELIANLEKKLDAHAVEESEAINKAVAAAIEKHVNGGIRNIHTILEKQNESTSAFHDKVDVHIETVNGKLDPESKDYILKEVVPFIQAKAGLTVLLKWLIILASGVVAWNQIKTGLWK